MVVETFLTPIEILEGVNHHVRLQDAKHLYEAVKSFF
jgi:hypothetical protein